MGLVENLSGLRCPYCGKIIELFKAGGGIETAKREYLRLLGTLPFEPDVVRDGDAGKVDFLDNHDLMISQEFNRMADEIVNLTGGESLYPGDNEKRIIQAGQA